MFPNIEPHRLRTLALTKKEKMKNKKTGITAHLQGCSEETEDLWGVQADAPILNILQMRYSSPSLFVGFWDHIHPR